MTRNGRCGIAIDKPKDALCLSFLQHELAEFSLAHSDEKVIDIIAKTWRKMSERGHRAALALAFSEREAALVHAALQRPLPSGPLPSGAEE